MNETVVTTDNPQEFPKGFEYQGQEQTKTDKNVDGATVSIELGSTPYSFTFTNSSKTALLVDKLAFTKVIVTFDDIIDTWHSDPESSASGTVTKYDKIVITATTFQEIEVVTNSTDPSVIVKDYPGTIYTMENRGVNGSTVGIAVLNKDGSVGDEMGLTFTNLAKDTITGNGTNRFKRQ